MFTFHCILQICTYSLKEFVTSTYFRLLFNPLFISTAPFLVIVPAWRNSRIMCYNQIYNVWICTCYCERIEKFQLKKQYTWTGRGFKKEKRPSNQKSQQFCNVFLPITLLFFKVIILIRMEKMIALFFCELTVTGDPQEQALFSFRGHLAMEVLLGIGIL